MPVTTALTPSGLVGIAFVVRSRAGPQFVYHYPSHPSGKPSTSHRLFGTEFDTYELENPPEPPKTGPDEDWDFEGDSSDATTRPAIITPLEKLDQDGTKPGVNHEGVAEITKINDYHLRTTDGEHIIPWETLFGFPTIDLSSILTPAQAFNQQRFVLKLESLYFIGFPIHIREDGLWIKRKVKKNKKKNENDVAKEASGSADSTDVKNGHQDKNGAKIFDDNGPDMTMFNVVFIIRTSKAEANVRIDEIYENIAKRFNKALLHAQGTSNYVWKEAQMLLAMREKGKETKRPMSWLWADMLQRSTLCAAIRDVFIAVSKSEIATIHLGTTPALDFSLQIPVPAVLTSVPSNTQRAMPGLLVCSANALVDEEGREDPAYLNKHFALLLLDDEATIMSQIKQDDTELSAPLLECICLCKPNLSILQVAQTSSITLSSLLILAQHLIYWRKAVAVPPLHGRHAYTVSPNCDMRNLPTAAVDWKKAFPLAPSLPHFLSRLADCPVPYKSFAPSKDHRPTYMNMLAWLMRNGWVTQMRFFGWILVWPEIVYEVEYGARKASIEAAKKTAAAAAAATAAASPTSRSRSTTTTTPTTTTTIPPPPLPTNAASSIGDKAHRKSDYDEEKAEGDKDDSDSASSFSSDPDAPLSTEQAAENARLERLASKTAREAAEEEAAFLAMPEPVATAVPNRNRAAHLEGLAPYVIADPRRLKERETMYVAALGRRWTDPRAAAVWERWVKYFDGREDWEMICLKENMKRKETWSILLHFSAHLLVARHY